VITGFNTDIDCEGITYHIQTEDKGLATPLILSLVYNRGTILASKRSPYDDLLAGGGLDEQALIDRLQKQHKLICAAVRAGRIEDLKRMTMKDSASRQKGLVAQKEVKSVVENPHIAESKIVTEEAPTPAILKENSQPQKQPLHNQILFDDGQSAPLSTRTEETIWDIPLKILEEPIVEVVEVVAEETILPSEAVEIIADLAKNEKHEGRLLIELLDDPHFKGGERKTISLKARRGSSETGLNGVQILVKVIGTSFRPLIFHAKTNGDGLATVHLQLPHFKAGRAAILVRAISGTEEIELRRTIRQG
jgi:hypothetical protein